MIRDDTIAAIASGLTTAGIGVIRISGPDAGAVADRCLHLPGTHGARNAAAAGSPAPDGETRDARKRLSDQPSHTIHYGFVRDGDEVIDEVLVLWMRAPRTYTREDTVEIDCHGGPFVMRRILSAVLKCGARAAEPGEFTMRAFLNGRIDLSESEAVMNLIASKNEYARKTALSALRGSLSGDIREMRSTLLLELARIEAALDDPEHLALDAAYTERLLDQLQKLVRRADRMLASYDNGRLRREGIRTVIAGKPNTGKSSLLNLLTGEERAIVTEIAGTTRDVLEESVQLDGIPLVLVDTAGIRRTDDAVEQIGVERALRCAKEADLVLFVADASAPFSAEDEYLLELLGEPAGDEGGTGAADRKRRTIVLLNKSDLPPVLTKEEAEARTGLPAILFSAKEGSGLAELSAAVRERFFSGEVTYDEDAVLTGERQRAALSDARDAVLRACGSIREGYPEDFWTIDLMEGYRSLGAMIGEEVGDDVVEEIFSKFCVGK